MKYRHASAKAARNLAIYEARLAGRTLRSIAIEHGLHTSRIRQIVRRIEEERGRRIERVLGRVHVVEAPQG